MFAVLHLADFALQALLRATPDATTTPIALLDPRLRPARVLSCTTAARAHGVEPGQSSAQALARCAPLRLLSPRTDAETEAAAALLAAALSLSPRVEATAPGTCTIALEGLPTERRAPALHAALSRLATLGLRASAGAGSTPLLALYAARHATTGPTPLFFPNDERAFLAALPLSAAEPPAEIRPILESWGLRTLGDLAALPPAELTRRLGAPGLALWRRATGQSTRPLHLLSTPPTFTAGLELENPLETLEPLLFLLRRCIDRLALELHDASLAAAELLLTLPLADDTHHTHLLRLPEPSARADLLFAAARTHLETLRTPAPVVGLRLELRPVRAPLRQSGLFDRALRDPHRFAETLARVAALVGADRVGTPAPRDTHRPDTFQLTPPAPEITPLPPTTFAHPPHGLVLRRHRPPRPALVELDPLTRRPLALHADDLAGPIAACDGPWRASGDWWQTDQHWWREEWDVELHAPPSLHRLIRNAQGWFLEGEYD
jgi:protein ImuB